MDGAMHSLLTGIFMLSIFGIESKFEVRVSYCMALRCANAFYSSTQ